ncbi:MAG: hypothetical protein P8R42_05270 [Candidatus Binatia bacterium]|nr:hypothetical protein [Candidatus Binatia bacterium]
MKKMGIAVLAGAFVLVSVAAGHAGPNVGGKNFGIQARNIQRNQVQKRNEMYSRTGRPVTVSNWKWENSSPRRYRPLKVPMMKRVPANG